MGDWKRAIAAFHEIGFSLDRDEFESKLIGQKTVCLLQIKGVDFRYPFDLYIRGPYSPEFTGDYYAHSQEFRDLETAVSLSSEEIETVKFLDELFQKSPSLLEIGATYALLVSQMGKSPVEALRIVKQEKGFYRDTQIAKGVSKVKEFLFEPAQKDLEWLKDEVGPMQKASIRSLRY
ncbi:hypothetical protein E2N92_12435 [Methanofollis formosanus]|uniref:Uncharacterized protein n=1 Tax=Methanofollis formosanus TaxID=299308 RepID=A0A8G1A2I2_9EURY|nr:hypothetical protein [Methanofollis formosanus]QYZ80179.1 hypothetical protein E2N92_12435 [Methanofollis formosanus]